VAEVGERALDAVVTQIGFIPGHALYEFDNLRLEWAAGRTSCGTHCSVISHAPSPGRFSRAFPHP
jgi:hypothetical protein